MSEINQLLANIILRNKENFVIYPNEISKLQQLINNDYDNNDYDNNDEKPPLIKLNLAINDRLLNTGFTEKQLKQTICEFDAIHTIEWLDVGYNEEFHNKDPYTLNINIHCRTHLTKDELIKLLVKTFAPNRQMYCYQTQENTTRNIYVDGEKYIYK